MTIIVGACRETFAVLAADTRETSNMPGARSVPHPAEPPYNRDTLWVRPRVRKVVAHPTLAIAVARGGDSRGAPDLAAAVAALTSVDDVAERLRERFSMFGGMVSLYIASADETGARVESLSVGRGAPSDWVKVLPGGVARGLPYQQVADFYSARPRDEGPPEPDAFARHVQFTILDGIRHVHTLGLPPTSWPPIEAVVVDRRGARFVAEVGADALLSLDQAKCDADPCE